MRGSAIHRASPDPYGCAVRASACTAWYGRVPCGIQRANETADKSRSSRSHVSFPLSVRSVDHLLLERGVDIVLADPVPLTM